MTGPKTAKYRFDEFELDVLKRRLLRDGEVVQLKPKAFDLLAVLVENNGKLLSKEDLFRLVWGDQIVEETNLSVSVSAIRKGLCETANNPRYITNVSGRGYYFHAELSVEDNNGSAVNASPEPVENEPGSEFLKPKQIPDKKAVTASGRWKWAGAAIGVTILAVVSYFIYRQMTESAPPFHALAVNKLTLTGRAPAAAISPDGNWFVYTQTESSAMNSLWIEHVDGSGRLQLLPPYNKPISSVFFAPDGSRVYFIEYESHSPGKGTLFRIPLLGGVVERVRANIGNRVAISPDGKHVAYSKTDEQTRTSRLVIADLNGPERDLLSMPVSEGSFNTSISWSPDGKLIAVAANSVENAKSVQRVFTVAVENGQKTQVGERSWYLVAALVWTKDSTGLIAAIGEEASDLERQIWYLPTAGGAPQKLLADSNAYGSLVISADNSVLLAVQTQTVSNIWAAPADDLSAAKQITFDMLGKQAGWNSLDWTGDGHILFSGRLGKSDTIWEMNADGTDQRQVIPESARSQFVSVPDDGRFLVFMSNRSGRNEIWRANRNGSDIRQLTTGGDNENPNVSPDGRFVIYHSGRGATSRLYRIPADGGEPKMLCDQPLDWARFSPDNSLIAGANIVDGVQRMMVIPAEGGEPLKTFETPKTANVRLSVRWTPDSRSITYRDWQNGIWKQELEGGDPVRLTGLPAEKLYAYAWSRDARQFAYSRGTAVSDVVLLSSLK